MEVLYVHLWIYKTYWKVKKQFQIFQIRVAVWTLAYSEKDLGDDCCFPHCLRPLDFCVKTRSEYHLLSNDRYDSMFLCILLSMSECFFYLKGSKLESNTYPVHAWLIHALWVLLQFEIFTVNPWTFNVSRQMRHVGDPGHCSFIGWGWGIEGGWRLGTLGRKASTLNMRTWVLKWTRINLITSDFVHSFVQSASELHKFVHFEHGWTLVGLKSFFLITLLPCFTQWATHTQL